MLQQPASLIPKVLFDGKDNMIERVGLWSVPVIISISRRLQFYRKVATLSLNLINEDFNKQGSRRNKITLKETLVKLQHYDFIWCDIDLAFVRNEKAFEIKILYDVEPFVILYEKEFETISQYHNRAKINRLFAIFLYVVKHINENTKQPTWIGGRRMSEDLHIHIDTVYKNLDILRTELAVLVRVNGDYRTGNHIAPGAVSHHTRNMAEYLLHEVKHLKPKAQAEVKK